MIPAHGLEYPSTPVLRSAGRVAQPARPPRARRLLGGALALTALVGTSLESAAYEFATVEYPGAVLTSLGGVNNAGTAIGYAALADGSTVSFTYDLKRERVTTLPAATPGGYGFAALGINERGVIVGVLNDTPTTSIGAILDKKGRYTTFSVPGYASTIPRAVGRSGLVTGYAVDETGTDWTGFLYDPKRAELNLFTVPGALLIIPQGINGRGQLVGSVFLPDDVAYPGSPASHYGFLRDADGSITLFQVNGLPTRPRGITDAGLITGFVNPVPGEALGYTVQRPASGGYRDLSVPSDRLFSAPDAVQTAPQAIDNTGRIVGQFVDDTGGTYGFVALPESKAKKK